MLLIALIVIIAFAHGLVMFLKKNFNIKIIIKLILNLIYNNVNYQIQKWLIKSNMNLTKKITLYKPSRLFGLLLAGFSFLYVIFIIELIYYKFTRNLYWF